jgi:hypothetical protein
VGDCDTDHYLVVEKVRERLAVSKQTMHRFLVERFSLWDSESSGGERQPCKTTTNVYCC